MGIAEQSTPPRSTQQKLRASLDSREWGVRTLARAMADGRGQPQQTESIRRQLKRYLSATNPVIPSTATRVEMEDALGDPRDSLLADEDEAEAAEPVAGPYADLLKAVQAISRASAKAGAEEALREFRAELEGQAA